LVTLSEYFSGIGDAKAALLSSGHEVYRILGERVGEFFGQLHSPESRAKVKIANSETFKNSLAKDLILQEVVIPIQKHLTQFNIPNASALSHRVLEDYQRSKLPSEQCFVLGDFTPGTILLPAECGDGSQTLGVIDWEFSGLGRGPNGDMAQFLAHLHLLLMAALVKINVIRL
jgi:aminoglycoside phosphotransferase (APT) family kinase protein